MSARPSIPPPPKLRVPEPQRWRLANGLEVLLVERNRLPLLDALLVIRSGAGNDAPELAGRACLTAELLDAGTATRSQFDIARQLDLIGARLDASATWDCTSVVIQFLTEHAEPALDLLADIAVRATFPDAEFGRGREERKAAILQDLDDPDTLAGIAIARALFGRHHVYGVPTGGTLATIERMERGALVGFHGEHYRPANAFLVLVGDLGMDAAHAVLDRVFGGWKEGSARPPERPPVMERRETAIHLLDRPGAPQSELRIGSIGAARSSPDYFPLVVLNTVLGGTFTSRLNLRLRERGGYTYGAFSQFSFRRGTGPFVAGAAVQTEVTDKALRESLEEIERMREELVDPEELARAKQYLTLSLPRAFETNGSVASRLAEAEVYGLGNDFWSRYAREITAVGAVEVQDVARRYLDPKRLTIAVVGDAASVRGSLESLGIGPVHSESSPV